MSTNLSDAIALGKGLIWDILELVGDSAWAPAIGIFLNLRCYEVMLHFRVGGHLSSLFKIRNCPLFE